MTAPDTAPVPIRSALLVPGHDEGRLRAAAASPADAVVVDLEAAVPRPRLPHARELVVEVLPALTDAGKVVVVRVNPVGSEEIVADVEAVVRDGLYGVALAKAERAGDVAELSAMLDRAERDAGLRPGRTVVHPLIESAAAVRRAHHIARASRRVAHMGGIVAPGGDLARSMGFRGRFGGADTRYVREKVLVDARAAGVRFPLSGIPVEQDEAALRAAAQEARDLGYDGLLIGRRAHAEVVNEVFTPTGAEVAQWRALLAADGSVRRAPDEATRRWAAERLAVAERFGVGRSDGG